MTNIEKLRKCVDMIWNYGEIYSEKELYRLQTVILKTYGQHDELEAFLDTVEEVLNGK